MRHPFALLVVALLSFACSAPVTPGAGGAVTVDTFVAEYAPAACGSIFVCPGTDSIASARAVFETPALCAGRLRTVASAQLDDLLASIRAGRIRLDGATARRCFDRIATHCASPNLDLAGMCAEALQGTVAPGDACWRSLECVAGSYCDHGYGAARICPGTCRAQLEPGRTCTVARQCLASAGRRALCVRGGCVDATDGPDAAEGAPCGTIPAGAIAVTVVGCASGLYCATDFNGVSTCRRILTAGSPCMNSYGCAPGLTCLGSASTPEIFCRRLNVVDTVGGACDALLEAGYCNPLAGLRCGAAMTCERAGDGTVNAPCPAGNLTISCQAGLYCDTTSMTCQPRVAVGAACRTDDDCVSGECGDGPAPRCLERICD